MANRSGSGAQTDARQSDLSPYLANLKQQVEREWFPYTDQVSSQVVVYFSVNRAGDVLNASIAQSSGISELDQAALNAVYQASDRFGPLPAGYGQNTLRIEFTFTVTVQ